MNLLLISGHGAGDPGAVGTYNWKQYREADEARKVTAELQRLLREYADVTIYPTDRNAFADHTKGTLAAVAKFRKYDYVLEVHFNALRQDIRDGSTKGTEIYVTTKAEDTNVETAILRNVSAVGLRNRGVKRKNWSVIQTAKNAGVPAALLEICFIDDPDDMAVYTGKFSSICRGIASAMVQEFGLEETMTEERVRAIVREMLAGKDTTASKALQEEFSEAKAKGITDGSRPGGYATREQVAAMVLRSMKQGKG